jgi:ATP-dependent DNA ligase
LRKPTANIVIRYSVCRQDLEGIVAKMKTAPYWTEPPSWVKIKNPDYSQAVGSHERFEQMRARRAAGGE